MWLFIENMKSRHLHKIRNQLAILLIIAIILPVLTIQLINYRLTSQLLQEKNNAIMVENMLLSKKNAEYVIGDYQKLLYQISTDDKFLDHVNQFNYSNPNDWKHKSIVEDLEYCIRAHILMHPEIRAVGLIDLNQKTYFYTQKRSMNENLIAYFDNHSQELYDITIDRLYPDMSAIRQDDKEYDPANPCLYITHRMINHENMKILGTMILFISPAQINDAINNSVSSTYHFSDKVIVTSDNIVLCSKDNLTGYHLENLEGYQTLTTSSSKLERFQLTIVDIVDNKLLTRDFTQLWLTIYIIISIIMILSLLITLTFSKKIIRSTENMAAIMNALDVDNLTISNYPVSNNEMQTIETAFNQMVLRIRNLLAENKSQTEHILEINQKVHLAELKALELQINPHFLFNTIDTINWMAIREGCYDVSEQLSNLAKILRYTVYDINQVVTLSQEIEWLTCYLDLQKNRFRNKFDYDLSLPDNTLGCRLHKLLLQPFLENAIIHGFENILYKGHIKISAKILKDRFLLIRFIDNGSGIPHEKTEQINRLFSAGCENEFGIGLNNIACRMEGYYKGRSKVFVSSKPGETCFRIYIPLA